MHTHIWGYFFKYLTEINVDEEILFLWPLQTFILGSWTLLNLKRKKERKKERKKIDNKIFLIQNDRFVGITF